VNRSRRLAAAGVLTLGLALLGLAGCSGVGYYWQSASGHMRMLNAARPVGDWLSDADTPDRLKTKLALSQQIRSFAVTELQLPDNASYHRYADLKRNAVVWNVVAAPELALKLKTWCFPIAGCVGYRGYFDEAEARAEAARLKAEGLEVSVYGVPAYSTLGWMNWAGGDPLLNTFINYPEGELARLVFHELAHQVVYAAGDTMFNESFATTVERLGSARWLAERASPAARLEYTTFDGRRQQFRALALRTRQELERIYTSDSPADSKLAQKQVAMESFRTQYAGLKAGWDGYAGYDPFVAVANNASFGAQAAYDELVPAFEALFEHEGRDWRRFYDAVIKLAKLPREERLKALRNP
jgi:predicted aminopeptidase